MTTITIQLTDREDAILRSHLVDPEAYVRDIVANKVKQCHKRLAVQSVAEHKDDPECSAMPATDEALVDALLARPEYKDRAMREAELAAADAERQRVADQAQAVRDVQSAAQASALNRSVATD